MEPTDSYLRSKRNAVWFSGLLALSVVVGIKPVTDHSSLFPFTLEKPELLSEVLAVSLVYFYIQYVMNWYLQIQSVRQNRINEANFLLTSTISITSFLIYTGSKIPFAKIRLSAAAFINQATQNIGIEPAFIIDLLRSTGSGFIGAIIVSIFASKLVKDAVNSIAKKMLRKHLLQEEKLTSTLTGKHWVLVFNPNSKSGKKTISFHEDGSIEMGKNKNESSWRLNNGYLEILNSEGKVFSRFRYIESEEQFLHTNDEDTLSIKGQRLHPLEKSQTS